MHSANRPLEEKIDLNGYAAQVQFKTMVDFRINKTLQTGAVRKRTYRGAKVSIYFQNSP